MKRIALTLLVIIALSACSKEDENTITPSNEKSRTEILTAKAWKITAATENGKDVFTSFDECDKDDIFYFLIDGTYLKDDDKLKCKTTSPQFLKSTWELVENNTKLDIGKGEISEIVELTDEKLVLKVEAFSETVLVTFTAQ